MASPFVAPVTRQVSGRAAPASIPSGPESEQPLAATVAEMPVLDASGRRVLFGSLFRERRAVVVFVRVSAGGETTRSWDLARRLGRRLLPRPQLGEVHRVPQRVRGPRGETAGPGPSRDHPLEASGMRTAPLASLNGNRKAARQAKAIFSASEEA